MLQQPYISRHQRRRDETKNLPERIVPRHHRQNRAQRKVAHKALASRNVRRFIRQKLLGMLRVIAAHPGALHGFIHRGAIGLAHFHGHDAREFLFVRFQNFRGFYHPRRAAGEARLAEHVKGLDGVLKLLLQLRIGDRLKRFQHCSGGGIRAGDAHEALLEVTNRAQLRVAARKLHSHEITKKAGQSGETSKV